MESVVELRAGWARGRRVTSTEPAPLSEDARLVGAAQQGDRRAFAQLYSRYARMVHGILLARVPASEAADMAQDVFLQALRHLHRLRDAGAFGGWLAMIARNRANDYYRRAAETSELPDNLAKDDPPHTEAMVALAAIRSLPDAYRETLILRLLEGMTGPEIAQRTGMTPGSVRVNLHRGMKMLRLKLGWSKTDE